MKDSPAIFSPPMVAGLIREVEHPGTGKTMTRRNLYVMRRAKDGVVPASVSILQNHWPPPALPGIDGYWTLSAWHTVKPGDRLWVRERHWRWGKWIEYHHQIAEPTRWRFVPMDDRPKTVDFGVEAPGLTYRCRMHDTIAWWKRPSIFLPRTFSRFTLHVTATKIERLQEISAVDANAEGLGASEFPRSSVSLFALLWDGLHGIGAWDANPEVVAVTFRVMRANIDSKKAA